MSYIANKIPSAFNLYNTDVTEQQGGAWDDILLSERNPQVHYVRRL